MPKLIRKNLGWFLSGVLISLFVGFCFVSIFSIKAQEQIKIFPTAFDGDWQNPEATFSQDLGENATSIEFNIVNSAYPLEIPEFPVEEAATPPQEGIVFSGERSLELSNFSISEEFSDKIINNAQLRLSLAGRGEAGDRLIIEYYYQDTWQSLANFDLENEISNSLNGGYFLYALPIFENWEDLANLKIKFTYLKQQETGNNQERVYLDAIWLEVEFREEEPQAEEPLLAEDNFDSYRTGVLHLQGIWNGRKAGGDWLVVDSLSCPTGLPNQGKCLTLSNAATAEFENTLDSESSSVLPYDDNVVSFDFYPNWQGEPTVGFNLQWLSPNRESVQIHLDFNTQDENFFYIFLSDGPTDAAVFDLPLKQWHKIEMNINKITRQARFRVSGGEWTNFVSWSNPEKLISYSQLRGMVEGEENFYLDNFSFSELNQ